MFAKVNSTLQAAVDVIAPPCARIEDFKYHWHQVLQECQKGQGANGKQIIVSEETHAPKHLKQMLRILVEDSAECRDGTVLSPCLEYIIQERILVSLVSYAWADRPLGIRQYIYLFLSKVLFHLHFSYLHQMKIHKPLQAMIKATCEKKASPYENQEMEFLSIICEKIKEDKSIILLYIEPLTLTGEVPSGFTPNISGASTPTITEETNCEKKIGSKFPLVEALLNLCHSSDSQICAQAHECLLLIISLKEPRSSESIANHTLLSHYIASRLTTAAEMIPLDTEPALVEDLNILEKDNRLEFSSSDSEGEDCARDNCYNFPGKKETIEFLRWLTFFDKLIASSDCLLATSICSIIRELFLEGFFGVHFTTTEETVSNPTDFANDVLAFMTGLLTKILLTISSPTLVNTLILWLTEESEDGFTDGNMRQVLLKNCVRPPHHLQIQTLRLLQVMIERPGALAVQLLALNYISSRGYFDSSAAEHQQNSWSDEEDERYKQRDASDFTPGSIPISRTLAPANINKIVKRFLSLVPEEIRSNNNEDFDSYKADALRQYRDVCRRTPYHTWPREAVAGDTPSDCSSTASKESKMECDRQGFYEGPLLSIVLDFLENLPDQDYDINLQVTSLVSSLALVPHPHIHEFILNPTIPLNEGIRTPYTVLSSVIHKIHEPIMVKKDFKNYLKITRYQLLGTMEKLDYERDPDNDNKFETLIVIEEFIKELAAIAYAKYTCEGNLM